MKKFYFVTTWQITLFFKQDFPIDKSVLLYFIYFYNASIPFNYDLWCRLDHVQPALSFKDGCSLDIVQRY